MTSITKIAIRFAIPSYNGTFTAIVDSAANIDTASCPRSTPTPAPLCFLLGLCHGGWYWDFAWIAVYELVDAPIIIRKTAVVKSVTHSLKCVYSWWWSGVGKDLRFIASRSTRTTLVKAELVCRCCEAGGGATVRGFAMRPIVGTKMKARCTRG